MYAHFVKAIAYRRFSTNSIVFTRGWVIIVIAIATRFLGYVLPWGQMSLWGATVIINLLSVFSPSLVIWLWGGFRVGPLTVKFFYSLHFILPFVLLVLIFSHILMLHINGSNAVINKAIKIQFIPFFLFKDAVRVLLVVAVLICVILSPYLASDPENFSPANPSVSPLHIKPEWYFLHYYAILRAIPNKLGGVIFFALALVALLTLSLKSSSYKLEFFPIWLGATRSWVSVNLVLIGLGACVVEVPYIELRQILTLVYFLWFLLF